MSSSGGLVRTLSECDVSPSARASQVSSDLGLFRLCGVMLRCYLPAVWFAPCLIVISHHPPAALSDDSALVVFVPNFSVSLYKASSFLIYIEYVQKK